MKLDKPLRQSSLKKTRNNTITRDKMLANDSADEVNYTETDGQELLRSNLHEASQKSLHRKYQSLDMARSVDQRSFASPTAALVMANEKADVANDKLKTGTNDYQVQRAEKTFMNSLGPGQYSLPPLTGRASFESKKQNLPSFAFGQKLKKQAWHRGMEIEFQGSSSPPLSKYSPRKELSSLEKSPGRFKIDKAKRFQILSQIQKHQKQVPVQYGGIYVPGDISSPHEIVGNPARESALSLVEGLSVSESQKLFSPLKSYKQVSQGFGQRSDFTKLEQQEHDTGFIYEGAFNQNTIQVSAQKNVKNKEGAHTFGNNFDKYQKVAVPGRDARSHFYGRGPSHYLGTQSIDLKLLKRNRNGYSLNKTDRGLVPIKAQYKQMRKNASPGPGSYDTQLAISRLEQPPSIQTARNKPTRVKNQTSFGTADRDISFAKYAELNTAIYSKGLV